MSTIAYKTNKVAHFWNEIKDLSSDEKLQMIILLTSSLRGHDDIEGDDVPNETTKAALKEAQDHQMRLSKGLADDDNYVDMSSVDAMVKSIIG